MEFKYAKLRGKIVEKYGTLRDFSQAVGISQVSVSKKMQGKVGFSKADIEKWSALLGIGEDEYSDYFFT